MKHATKKKARSSKAAPAKPRTRRRVRGGTGGAATAIGVEYQASVGAWLAVHILCEQTGVDFGLATHVTLLGLCCEADAPVDDLIVETSHGGFLFFQVKSRIAQTGRGSDFHDSIDQFVKQYLVEPAASTMASVRWRRRPFDPGRDRFILATGPNSTRLVTRHVPAVLQRIKDLGPSASTDELATSREEGRALELLRSSVSGAWNKANSTAPTTNDVLAFLRNVLVLQVGVEGTGTHKQSAVLMLRTAVVANHGDADRAWESLRALCLRYQKQKSGGNREAIQAHLSEKGIRLVSASSFQRDIEALRRYAQRMITALKSTSEIVMGGVVLKLTRQVVASMASESRLASFAVVGDPGAGKSGALHDLAVRLTADGHEILLLQVQSLPDGGLAALTAELDIEHQLVEVLSKWQPPKTGIVIIDALDAARTEARRETVHRLLADIGHHAPHWKVVASVRRFDLGASPELAALFPGPAAEGASRDFPGVRHIEVPLLTQYELNEVSARSPTLHDTVATAGPELREILRTPFNLRLLAELLTVGETSRELSGIRTQMELFERYWMRRVLYDARGDARNAVAKVAADLMIADRSLRCERLAVVGTDSGRSELLFDLLSAKVLAAPPDGAASAFISFSHQLLFDYAVARLCVRRLAKPEELAAWLAETPDLVLLLRPALELHFLWLWQQTGAEHEAFWSTTLALNAAKGVPELAKLLGPSVAAREAKGAEDLARLVEAVIRE